MIWRTIPLDRQKVGEHFTAAVTVSEQLASMLESRRFLAVQLSPNGKAAVGRSISALIAALLQLTHGIRDGNSFWERP